MSVKISELPILDSLADNDVIAGVDTSANVTSKIEMATLKNYIDTNTQYTAGTNINITNNVISAPFVYDKTQTNALLDDFKDETNALIEDLETNINEQLEEKDEQIEELQSEVDSLSMIYNAFPTESGEGESLTLDDTAEVKFKKFDLKGNTSQFSTTGINLAKVDYSFNQTTNGITCKVNSDGSISLSGTASANTTFIMSTGLGYPSGAYAMSCVGMPTNSDSIRIRFRNTNATYSEGDANNSAEIAYNKNPRTFTNRDVNNFEVFVFSGVTLNSTIKVQLQTGSSATSFEPYTNGASPNPSYPQPVNVVSGDNEIQIWGESLAGNDTQQYRVNLKAGDKIKIINKSGSIVLNMYTNFGDTTRNDYWGVTGDTTRIVTVAYDTNAIAWSAQPSVGNQVIKLDDIDTYNIDLPVENLLPISSLASTTSNGITFTNNNDGTYTLNGTATAEATFYIFDGGNSLTANSQITFSCKEANSNIRLFWYDNWDTISGSSARIGGVSPNYTTTNNISTIAKLRINISIVNGATINNVTIKPMIQKGTKVNSFTPYGTTPIELCKIGNYQDYFYKDSGKWYLHKEITKYIFTGNETGVLQNSGKRFDITCSDNNMPICINNSAPSEISQIYCNILLASSGASTWGGNQGISYNTGTNGQILVSISGATTTQAYLNALKDNYCYYILATPIDEPVEYQPLIDQLNLLEKAMSKDGQTNISQVNNDKPFILDVTAIKSLQNVLDRIELLES